MTRLNKSGFQELIAGDLEWLAQQPRTLEREHIAECLRALVELHEAEPWAISGDIARLAKERDEAKVRAEKSERDARGLRGLLTAYDLRRRGRCDWCGSSGEHEATCPAFEPNGAPRQPPEPTDAKESGR